MYEAPLALHLVSDTEQTGNNVIHCVIHQAWPAATAEQQQSLLPRTSSLPLSARVMCKLDQQQQQQQHEFHAHRSLLCRAQSHMVVPIHWRLSTVMPQCNMLQTAALPQYQSLCYQADLCWQSKAQNEYRLASSLATHNILKRHIL